MTRKKWEDKFATKDNIRFMAIKVQELETRIKKLERLLIKKKLKPSDLIGSPKKVYHGGVEFTEEKTKKYWDKVMEALQEAEEKGLKLHEGKISGNSK